MIFSTIEDWRGILRRDKEVPEYDLRVQFGIFIPNNVKDKEV